MNLTHSLTLTTPLLEHHFLDLPSSFTPLTSYQLEPHNSASHYFEVGHQPPYLLPNHSKAKVEELLRWPPSSSRLRFKECQAASHIGYTYHLGAFILPWLEQWVQVQVQVLLLMSYHLNPVQLSRDQDRRSLSLVDSTASLVDLISTCCFQLAHWGHPPAATWHC